MPTSVPKLSLTRHLAALCAAACLLPAATAGAAQAATAGVVPPHNPASDCTAGAGTGISGINACRAAEGVGPLRLPNNWASLTPAQQGFVLIDLERVNRGLPAIVGLSAPLNGLASSAAANGSDPSFPAAGFSGGGGIWAGTYSVFGADYMWMYVDGPGGSNLDCTSANTSGCWGHRDIILWDRSNGPLVSGGGFASAGGTDSFAYLVLSGYSTSHLTFTWTGELKHFAAKPGVEPLGKTASARRRHKPRHRRRALRHHSRHKRRHTPTSTGTASSSSASSSDSGPTITIG